MRPDDFDPKGKGHAPLLALLPALAGQAYLVWMVWSGKIDYVQVAVTAMIEVLLVLLISAVLLSPNGRTARSRLGEMVVVAICNGMVLQVLLLMPTRRSTTQFHDALSALASVGASFPQMFSYLGLVLGGSCVAAWAGGDSKFWWYRNVTSQAGVTFLALFLSALMVWPVNMLIEYLHASTFAFAVAWTALYAAVRLLLSYGISSQIPLEKMRATYATYAAGEPTLLKHKMDFRQGAFGLPFLLIGVAVVVYAISILRADASYDSTALKAEGIVVDVREFVGRKNQTSIAAIIEFNDDAGKKMRIETPKLSGTQWYHTGAHVTMLYQPGHPEEARVDNVGNADAYPYVVGAFGLIMVLVGLFVAYRSITDSALAPVEEPKDPNKGFGAMDRAARNMSDS